MLPFLSYDALRICFLTHLVYYIFPFKNSRSPSFSLSPPPPQPTLTLLQKALFFSEFAYTVTKGALLYRICLHCYKRRSPLQNLLTLLQKSLSFTELALKMDQQNKDHMVHVLHVSENIKRIFIVNNAQNSVNLVAHYGQRWEDSINIPVGNSSLCVCRKSFTGIARSDGT